MSVGSWTLFDRAVARLDLADMDGVGTFKMTLHDADQALSVAFAGGSGNAEYADLTDELPTASGYVAGGVTMTGLTVNRSGDICVWTGDPAEWTLSAGINVRYAVIRDDTTDLLVAFLDLDTSLGAGVELAIVAGFLRVKPNTVDGWITWETV